MTMPKQDAELREIVLQMYFMEEFEDYTYEQLEKNFDRTQLPKIEEKLKLWRDKSVNEARIDEVTRFYEDEDGNITLYDWVDCPEYGTQKATHSISIDDRVAHLKEQSDAANS